MRAFLFWSLRVNIVSAEISLRLLRRFAPRNDVEITFFFYF